MPGVVDCLATAEAPAMLGDDASVLTNDYPICISLDLNRPMALRHCSRQCMESVKAAAKGDEVRPLLFEDFSDGSFRSFGMGMRLGVFDACRRAKRSARHRF
jgi:hypothetical protein